MVGWVMVCVIGVMVCVVLVVNNLCDIDGDCVSGKYIVVIKLGY